MLGWHYWLAVIGLVIMFLDLLCAGLVHGYMLKSLAPWMDIVNAMKPFWWVRSFAGGMILAGNLIFAWNLWKTATTPKAYDWRRDVVGEVN